MADLFDYYDVNDNIAYWIAKLTAGGKWQAQSFTTGGPTGGDGYTLESIDLLIYKGVGADPWDLIVSVQGMDGGGPDGVDIDSATAVIDAGAITEDTGGLWYKLTLDSSIALDPFTQYAIVARTTNPNTAHRVYWRAEVASPPGYSGGSRWESADAGANWTEVTAVDFMFRCYGTAEAPVQEGSGTTAIVTTASGSAKVSKKVSGTTAIVTTLSGGAQIHKLALGTIAIVTTSSGRAGAIRSVSGSIGIVFSITGFGSYALLEGIYRANNKKGYLSARLTPTDTRIELQDIDYGGGAKDRNIPTDEADKAMRLVIWGVQYPNPSAAPDREIVSAIWVEGQVFDIERAQEGTEAHDHYIGDNIALLFTADMSREVLIFEDLEDSPHGSIAYIGDREVLVLLPDDEVSEEGYKKILCSAGPEKAPYWEFAFDPVIGASKR